MKKMANEKRLIDANALLAEYDRVHIGPPGGARKLMEDAPTVDAVEVVRCKDCKHWLKDVAGCTDVVGRCEWANYMVGAVGYCVYGERKDNESI